MANPPVSNKYTATPPPQGAPAGVFSRFVQWIANELVRIAGALDAVETTTVTYGKEYQTVADTDTCKIAWRNRQKQSILLKADVTTMVWDPPFGACNTMMRFIQDDVGGWTFVLPDNVHCTGGTMPTWSTAANAVDVVAMYYDGAAYHITASIDSKVPTA